MRKDDLVTPAYGDLHGRPFRVLSAEGEQLRLQPEPAGEAFDVDERSVVAVFALGSCQVCGGSDHERCARVPAPGAQVRARRALISEDEVIVPPGTIGRVRVARARAALPLLAAVVVEFELQGAPIGWAWGPDRDGGFGSFYEDCEAA